MAEKKEIIIDIQVDSKAAEKRTADFRKRLEESKQALNATKKAIKELDQSSETYAADLARLTAEQVKNENAVKRAQSAYNVQNKIFDAQSNSVEALTAQNARYEAMRKRIDTGTERGAKLYAELTNRIDANKQKLKDLNNAVKGEISAYKQLSDKLTQMRGEYRDLAATQASGNKLSKDQVKRLKELEKQIQETDKALKDIDATMGQFPRVVGDYKNAISQAIQENQGLMGSFGNAGGAMGEMEGALGQVGKALMSLAANPIGAVIAILGALVAAFSQTASGASKFKEMFGGLSQIFNKITGDLGKFAQKVLDFGSLIINEPMKALEMFGNAIKTNVINRVQGALNLFPAIGKVIKEALSGNFEAAGTAAKDAADAFIQFQTGIEGGTDAIADYGKELGDAYDQGVKFVKIQKAIEQQNRALLVSQAQLTGALELSRAALNDDTIGWIERRKAGIEAIDNAEKLAEVERKLAKNRLASINVQIAARKAEGLSVTEFADEQAQAMADVITAENNYKVTMRDLGEERRKMTRDEMEAQLDVLIDASDKRKAIAEKQISDARVDAEARKKLLTDLEGAERSTSAERLAALRDFDAKQKQSVDEREALLKRTEDDFTASTESFVKLIERQEGKVIDLDKILAATSNEEQARMVKELNLSEISGGRLLEIIKEKQQAEQDFTDASNMLLDERIAAQKTKLEKQVADEQALMQLKVENERVGNEARLAMLDAQYQADLVKYEANEAMKAEITKRYELAKTDIKKASEAQQLAATADMLGQAGALFEEQTIAYKVLMSAQAAINTYTAATAAYASAAAVPVVGYILGPIAAGFAVATGLANIAKINNVQFADGGEIKGKSHAQGGVPFSVGGRVGFEAEGGEYITNKRSTAQSFDAIATINANPDVKFEAIPVQYADGGAVSGAYRSALQTQAIESAYANSSPVVTVTDIRRAEARVTVRDQRSRFSGSRI